MFGSLMYILKCEVTDVRVEMTYLTQWKNGQLIKHVQYTVHYFLDVFSSMNRDIRKDYSDCSV